MSSESFIGITVIVRTKYHPVIVSLQIIDSCLQSVDASMTNTLTEFVFLCYRFLAICFPLKFQITTRRARKIIVIIWLYSLIVPIPWLIFFDLHKVIAGDDTIFCLEEWPFGGNGSLYFIFFNVILGYLLPLLVISVCYVHIYVKVWKRDIPTDSKNAQMERMQQNSKIKVSSCKPNYFFCASILIRYLL